MVVRAEVQIAPNVIGPTEQNSFWEIDIARRAIPHGCERFGFAEAALVSLLWRVVMRMHYDRVGDVNDLITLRAAPACVFVVFGVLHFFEEPAPTPDVLAQAAADHAEEMFPSA